MTLIGHAEDASTTRGRGRRFMTVGATGDMPRRADAIQYELGSGPCVDAALESAVFRTGELKDDERWPAFGRRAYQEAGVRSMLSLRLFIEDDDILAGLNLYSTKSDAFDDGDVALGLALTTHAALALTAELHRAEATQLRSALETNRTIGIAIGILMRGALVSRDQAFDLLRMASQRSHRKLADVALEVVETGWLAVPD